MDLLNIYENIRLHIILAYSWLIVNCLVMEQGFLMKHERFTQYFWEKVFVMDYGRGIGNGLKIKCHFPNDESRQNRYNNAVSN